MRASSTQGSTTGLEIRASLRTNDLQRVFTTFGFGANTQAQTKTKTEEKREMEPRSWISDREATNQEAKLLHVSDAAISVRKPLPWITKPITNIEKEGKKKIKQSQHHTDREPSLWDRDIVWLSTNQSSSHYHPWQQRRLMRPPILIPPS